MNSKILSKDKSPKLFLYIRRSNLHWKANTPNKDLIVLDFMPCIPSQFPNRINVGSLCTPLCFSNLAWKVCLVGL